LASSTYNGDEEIIFSEELGLAIQKPPNGVSIESLWKII